MCGIAGICGSDNYIDDIKAMCDAMIHRGPDAYGYWHDDVTGVTLGHRRLSIIDLSKNGSQPMVSQDGRYVIVYNGEIYNSGELRDRLLADDTALVLRGTSDTEILLESYARYGIDAIKEAKGMFAIAIFDRESRTLTLMRDRAGEKPLYYGRVGGKFVFASDLGCMRALKGFDAKISRDALAEYFRYAYISAPNSIYEGIYKLCPGQVLTIEAPYDGEGQISRYWSMHEEAVYAEEHMYTGSYEEACEELERLLSQSVRGQMMADVPLGAYLSGGIDSPLIVSLMQKQSASPIKTFTIGFDDPKYNEAAYAADIAAHLGTDHTELYVSEKELQEVVPKLPTIFTEPMADSSQIPTYLVSKLAKSKVTVSLSGDAGDELFCGYNTYWKCQNLWDKVEKIPYGMRHAAAGILRGTGMVRNGSYYRISECLDAKNAVQLQEAVCNRMDYIADHIVPGAKQKPNDGIQVYRDEMSSMLYKDICGYHPEDILVKVDRTGMAVSLENRVPMLDRDVIRFALALPIDYKYAGNPKRILKDILYRYVPKEMLDRPKKGFSVPIKDWLKAGPIADMSGELLRDSKLAADGYIDGKMLSKVMEEFGKNGSHSTLMWKLLVAEEWYRDATR